MECARWCHTNIVARSILPPRYHTHEEKCAWRMCAACASCIEQTVVPSSSSSRTEWKPVNLRGGTNLQRFDFLDHRACLERCKSTMGCAGVVWNCDAVCYLKRAPLSYGAAESCTFSHILTTGPECPTYTVALPVPRQAIDLPPTVCCDPPYSPTTPAAFAPPLVAKPRVLLVTPAGYRAHDVIRARCRTTSALRLVDVHVAHYDASSAWYARQVWFTECVVAASTIVSKVKSVIVKRLLERHRSLWYSLYSHIWMVDDDIVFPPSMYVAHFLHHATERGFLISQPATFGSTHLETEPRENCAMALTEFVEIMMPLVRLDILENVLHVYLAPNVTSDWGIDYIWCRHAANLFPDAASCGIVKSGVFRHVSTPEASTYSHSKAMEELACRRAAHPLLAPPSRALICLQSDAFNSGDGALADRHVVNQFWTMPSHQLRMYVYDLEHVNVHFCAPRGEAANNFEWELHIADSLLRIFPRVTDPKQADFYVLPACPSTAWANGWDYKRKRRRKLSSNVSETRAYESLILSTVRRVGNFFDMRPDRHLLARHKCPLVNEGWWESGAALMPYAHLWTSRAMRYVCIETDVQSMHRRDLHREVHVPYFMDSRTTREVTPYRHRIRRYGYSGSFCCGRSWLRRMLPNDSVRLLVSHMGRDYRHRHVADFLQTSMYAIQPHGDTPERRNIYEALHAGTPNIFVDAVAPPLRYNDWGTTAHTLSHGREARIEDEALLQRLQTYDAYMSRFSVERQRFMWNSREFLDRLYAIVCDVFAVA